MLGRIDHQVKIRGHRIELHGIEAILNTYPKIERSIVALNEESKSHLVAYIKLKCESDDYITREELFSFLEETLTFVYDSNRIPSGRRNSTYA